jgi:arginine exporter protein ArgO
LALKTFSEELNDKFSHLKNFPIAKNILINIKNQDIKNIEYINGFVKHYFEKFDTQDFLQAIVVLNMLSKLKSPINEPKKAVDSIYNFMQQLNIKSPVVATSFILELDALKIQNDGTLTEQSFEQYKKIIQRYVDNQVGINTEDVGKYLAAFSRASAFLVIKTTGVGILSTLEDKKNFEQYKKLQMKKSIGFSCKPNSSSTFDNIIKQHFKKGIINFEVPKDQFENVKTKLNNYNKANGTSIEVVKGQYEYKRIVQLAMFGSKKGLLADLKSASFIASFMSPISFISLYLLGLNEGLSSKEAAKQALGVTAVNSLIGFVASFSGLHLKRKVNFSKTGNLINKIPSFQNGEYSKALAKAYDDPSTSAKSGRNVANSTVAAMMIQTPLLMLYNTFLYQIGSIDKQEYNKRLISDTFSTVTGSAAWLVGLSVGTHAASKTPFMQAKPVTATVGFLSGLISSIIAGDLTNKAVAYFLGDVVQKRMMVLENNAKYSENFNKNVYEFSKILMKEIEKTLSRKATCSKGN